ncbi:SDR family NAD(P)-dependent oxidoreductase [Salinispira pacifica]
MAKDRKNRNINPTVEGRVALVTGASRGIGRAISVELARRGAIVAVHYNRNGAAAEAVVEEITESGGRAAAFAADLTDSLAPGELVRRVRIGLGAPTILVSNAGEMEDAEVESMPDELWGRTIALGLDSPFRLCRSCIPFMKESGWGRIVCVSSQAAFTGSARHAHYAAAKSGLHGLVHSLAKEAGSSGVTVNLVAPGRIATDLLKDHSEGRMAEWMAQTPLRRLGKPEEVAAAVAFLCSPEAAYITGSTIHVNGGMLMS